MSYASMLLPKRLVATFIKDMWSVEHESFNKIVIPTYIYCMDYILNTIVLFMEVNTCVSAVNYCRRFML